MNVGRSKSGLPTITENGGGMTNTGYATIVCGSSGEKLKPLFVPRGYSNGVHAIFVVKPGITHLISASRGNWGETARVEKVIEIYENDCLITETIGEYENGDGNITDHFSTAVDAAIAKTKSYHCRSPFYIKD